MMAEVSIPPFFISKMTIYIHITFLFVYSRYENVDNLPTHRLQLFLTEERFQQER